MDILPETSWNGIIYIGVILILAFLAYVVIKNKISG